MFEVFVVCNVQCAISQITTHNKHKKQDKNKIVDSKMNIILKYIVVTGDYIDELLSSKDSNHTKNLMTYSELLVKMNFPEISDNSLQDSEKNL